MPFFSKTSRAAKRSSYRFIVATLSLLLATGTFLYNQQQAAAIRFEYRSLYINSSYPGARTFYTVQLQYPRVDPVGSIKILFCTEAIAYLPCDPPTGLDVSGAILNAQSGLTGFSIKSQTQNTIIIGRAVAAPTGLNLSTYNFDNVVNPTGVPDTFYARLTSHASTDGTGPLMDFGSIASSTTQSVGIITQVPPYLVFCTGKVINSADCSDVEGPNFEEFPDPSAEEEMTTTSEMMAYTNARNGLSIVMTGRTLTSGIYEIPPILDTPEESLPGKGQFGVNLTENSDPDIGDFPVGPGANAVLNSLYTEENKFVFNDGDTLVVSNGVTKPRKFTVSYIINIPPDQRPGVYSTTVTYICTGSF
jgi:hypothetical protein